MMYAAWSAAGGSHVMQPGCTTGSLEYSNNRTYTCIAIERRELFFVNTILNTYTFMSQRDSLVRPQHIVSVSAQTGPLLH